MFVTSELEKATLELIQQQTGALVDSSGNPIANIWTEFPRVAYNQPISDGTEFGYVGTEEVGFRLYKGQSDEQGAMQWPCVIVKASSATGDQAIPGNFTVPLTVSIEIDSDDWTGQPDQSSLIVDASSAIINLFQRDDAHDLINRFAGPQFWAIAVTDFQHVPVNAGRIHINQLEMNVYCANRNCSGNP